MSLIRLLKKIPNYYYTSAVGWLSRAASAVSRVIAISIVLGYLGTDLYAVFVLITGLVSWFPLVSLGVGRSLQNYISEARVNKSDINIILSNVSILLVILGVCSIFLYSILAYPLQYFLLHKISYDIAMRQWYLLLIVGNIYILTVLFNVASSVFFAELRAHLAYLYQLAASLGAVVCAIVFRYCYYGDYKLFGILMAWALPPLIANIASYFHAFPFRKITFSFQKKMILQLLTRGIKFWLISVSALLAFNSQYLIMSQTLTAHDVTIFNILDRGYSIIFFIYQAVLLVIWPMLSEMFAEQKWNEANRILAKNILLGLLVVIMCTLVLLFGKQIIMKILASRENLFLPSLSILLFGFYYVLRILYDAYAVGLQSQNRFKIFWSCLPWQIILSIAGMYLFSRWLGMNGILLGLILSMVVTANWILPYEYYQSKNQLKR